jgi:hypothetical protein
MKKIFLLTILSLPLFLINLAAQDISSVEAKGVGVNRTDALQDALRNAIGQAVGVALKSETRVENFMVISDAIATNTKGYIKNYSIVREVPFPDRFEVTVKADVTTSTLKADFNLIARSIGGVRFLVMVDPKDEKGPHTADLQFAVDRINSFLAERNYRYIDKTRFQSLKREAMNMMEESNDNITYVQRLGIMADAQFIILVSDLSTSTIMGAFDIPRGTRVGIAAKAFDNCTAEGLGTVILQSSSNPTNNQSSDIRGAIGNAVENGFQNLMGMFTGYIGGWVNNGTPFELRFYNTGSFRDLRDLRNKLKQDKNFGGDLQITSVMNYTKINCTFNSKSDDLADKILDLADEIPSLAKLRLDVKMIYGRQISFAPQNFIIPNLVQPTSID